MSSRWTWSSGSLHGGLTVLAIAPYSYFHARGEVAQRHAEVRALQKQKQALLERLAFSTSTDALAREARRLGFVRPGEHLYIVKGIPAWRTHRATIARNG